MSSLLRRWVVVLASVAVGGALMSLPGRPAAARAASGRVEVASAEQLTQVDQLKSEAFKELRNGRFDRTSELLGKAAAIAHDPGLEQMLAWTSRFESQRKEFAAERRKQYEKEVGDVRLLLKNNLNDFAIDAAARAHLLADDKKVFRAEKWVDDLIVGTITQAEEYDRTEQWLKSLRLYSDLGSVEPANPLWKERLKLATRRVRLLALYTPEVLKALQEGDSKEREHVEALLKPKAEGDAAAKADAEKEKADKQKADKAENDAFKIDWRETLRGVRMEMLTDALVDARNNYYKDVSYKDLTLGGLEGIRAIVTTKGLEKAFPNLADTTKRGNFLQELDKWTAAASGAGPVTEQGVLRGALKKLKLINLQSANLPEEVLVSEFADGAFAELDPFTGMIWPNDLEEFNKTTQGEFSGVGIQIQSDEDGSLKVVSPLEDSPAYKAGIKAGDVVTHINGKNAKGITLNQAVKTITGPKHTSVRLTVRSPNNAVKEYTIRRDTIKVASIKGWLHLPGGGWDYFVDRENKIGYLRMTNFTKDTAKELDRALAEMEDKGAQAVILDLRYNPGGLLTAATDVSDKFLRDGTIVSTRPDRPNGNQPTEAMARADGESNLPLVVLVNQYSASASEIVSGALKDQGRALVVGERTFGKGSVQMLFPLSDRTAYLKLTTSHYYLPSGRCIHREENSQDWGVNPDVTVEMTPEQMRAAIDARQELDILRDINATPAEGELEKIQDLAPEVREAVGEATEKEATDKGDNRTDAQKKEAVAAGKKDLLSSDPQLSAAVLLLRLQLAGAQL